jgi:thiol-disulfide isomerase/thioredoxin
MGGSVRSIQGRIVTPRQCGVATFPTLLFSIWLALGALFGSAARADEASGPLDLSAYRGRVVYLDFWASWCAPCRLSFRFMKAMNAGFSSRDFAIVTVNVDHDRAAAEAFLRQNGPGLTMILDPKGERASTFHVETMPTSLIIDRAGRVRYVHKGYIDGDSDQYRGEVSRLIAEKGQ